MRLLVFSPHPDDEALACGGLIQQSAGVVVCYVTAGDGFQRSAETWTGRDPPRAPDYLALGHERIREARAASGLLGAAPIILGFPDGALIPTLHATTPVTSPWTLADAVPYAQSDVPGAPYTRAALLGALSAVVEQVAPELIAAPTPLDQHETHRATALAVRLVAPAVPRLEYVVHTDLNAYPGYGLDWERWMHPDPDDLPGPYHQVEVSRAQRQLKLRAIDAHVSQVITPLLGPWLDAFVARNEPFTDLRGAGHGE